jgi:integrase
MSPPSLLELVDSYLDLRRRLGFDPEGPRWYLRSFARYVDRIGHTGPITVALTAGWALSSSTGQPARAERRLGAVRAFARHRAAIDPATEIPPPGLFGRAPRRQPPHNYSDREIAALLRACRGLQPRSGLRPATYGALFSLLAATGLRLSEALRLERRDVDLAGGLLTVRESKFRKSRLVPLHPTVTEGLSRYAARRDTSRRAPRSGRFFQTDRALVLGRAAVEKTFARLRNLLGWTDSGRARRPRIHDLRHTMAVRSLLGAYTQGNDIDRRIHALSTYLGHAKVTDTYWYLSAVPELMAIASQRFEQFARRRQESAP